MGDASKISEKAAVKKRKHPIRLILAVLVIIILIFILLVPVFISSEKGNNIILSKINDSST